MKKEFEFPDIDKVGIDTLESISIAVNFNQWMYKTISQFCSGKTLEIGSGIGNISQCFIDDDKDITLTDIRDNYIETLKEKFPQRKDKVQHMDLVNEEFDTLYEPFLGQYDSVFALNVVEHIKDDTLALQNASKLLKTGGKLIILVPAYQVLYNTIDEALEHYRRYTKKTLNGVMNKAKGLDIEHSQYFNAFGMLGWFVTGSLLKSKTVPINKMRLYDKLLFIAKTLDILTFNKIGLSVISVASKK